jgi:predicted CoA-binding protein
MGADLPDGELRRVYAEARTIAVVGASNDESKAANRIPRYLKRQGYRVIPVNPRGGRILDEDAVTSLAEIKGPVDVVDVFRPSEETPELAREAASIGAKVLWLQQGIHSDEAQRIAEEAGMAFLSDRCMGATHHQLGLSVDGVGPG